MKTRRLYTLLVLWVVLLTAPATLTALGVFGSANTHKSVSGGLAACWIVGYLAQFGIFMWIMALVQSQDGIWRTVLWWFSASLLPWALDWTPLSSLLLPVWYAAAIGLAVWIAFATRGEESFKERAVRATGVVLEVLKPMMNVVINNVYIKRKVRLRIERSDGAPPYEATWNGLFMLGEIPSPGDRIPIVIDPESPQRIEYDDSKSADSTSASAVAAASSTASSRAKENIGEELERLASLHERGALTDAEFAAAKKKLLR
ncbi:MAG TPA: SHOCT domain-containing protein [Candidatus Sulfotelmatobacter sp.]|nr:SHOCT domain-containing protein [Candidatus Sulfotelmatobacter sp.]